MVTERAKIEICRHNLEFELRYPNSDSANQNDQ